MSSCLLACSPLMKVFGDRGPCPPSRVRPPMVSAKGPVRYRAGPRPAKPSARKFPCFESSVRSTVVCRIHTRSKQFGLPLRMLDQLRRYRFLRLRVTWLNFPDNTLCTEAFNVLGLLQYAVYLKLAHTQYKRLLLNDDTRSKLILSNQFHLIPFYLPYATPRHTNFNTLQTQSYKLLDLELALANNIAISRLQPLYCL